LRGVSPMNARMPELRQAFEAAGFTAVKSVLSSGNVVFDARRASEAALQRAAEAAMRERLGQAFSTIVRPVEVLQQILASDPYHPFRLGPSAKRIVTFLRSAPAAAITLPVEQDGARLLALVGRELFSAYVPSPKGPVFMTLIERTVGKEATTRTWDSVARIARA
ncbi:MAG: DUF1697 domain-containing protein, partial [Gemmatimonadales bacterium]